MLPLCFLSLPTLLPSLPVKPFPLHPLPPLPTLPTYCLGATCSSMMCMHPYMFLNITTSSLLHVCKQQVQASVYIWTWSLVLLAIHCLGLHPLFQQGVWGAGKLTWCAWTWSSMGTLWMLSHVLCTGKSCCAALPCAVLCCAVLCCVVLCHVMLCCVMLCWIELHQVMSCHIMLCCFTICNVVLSCITLLCE